MPKEKSRVFIALGTSLLKWHAILGRFVFFVNTPRWTRVKAAEKNAVQHALERAKLEVQVTFASEERM